MNFELNKIYHGFKLVEEKDIKEINSKARMFEHEKSGARLLSIENDDDNKVFTVGFRTPPTDSTGVPHIMEHSVLCGSRKFPIKDPFVELAKGSLNTFLNAMTYSDKTIYPVASKNDKDFLNLMDVYLDAVFYPNIYKYPEILMQEGWHYELNSKEEEITYKGVVYNEMKGAFSSPEDLLYRKIQESLFPDTTYGVESGGDPQYITDLTYEQFLDFHKKFYHPSNSYLYLYGNGEIEKQLKFINEEYLNNFNKIEVDSKISLQKAFGEIRNFKAEYPVGKEDQGKDKTFLSLNFVLGDACNDEVSLAFDILEYLLLETPAAPLKEALIDAGIGKDVYGFFDGSILQPVFSIVVKNSNEDKKEEFKNIVFNTLKKLVEDGIDKRLVEACINVKEFRLREGDTRSYPKGLLYYTKAMTGWLYDSDPLMPLEYERVLGKVKTALTTNYFEELIKKYLINVNHGSLITLVPKANLAEEKAESLKRKLKEYKDSLSEEEIEKIISQTKALRERQTTPESKEDIEKIPLLSLEDIDPKAEKLPLVEKFIGDNKVLLNPIFTNKIAYIKFIFDTRTVDEKHIPYLTLLSGILGRIGTEKFTYADLSNEINIYTGGISYGAASFTQNGTMGEYLPKFIVRSKSLVDKVPKVIEILEEILLNTKIDDKKRLKEIIQEIKSRLEMAIFDSGHIVAANRLFSYFSPVGKYEEVLSGFDFFRFMEDLEENFDSKIDEIICNLKEVSNLIFNRKNLIISLASENEDYEAVKKDLEAFINKLNDNDLPFKEYKFEVGAKNEGLLTQGDVQYVIKGCNFRQLGYEYKGSLQVLKTIQSLDYLWSNVRVLGGAYGSFASFGRSGNMFFGSYRDPNLKETIEIYNKAEDYLRNFNADEREMTKYIIGTISNFDLPLTPSLIADKSVTYYLSNVTQADVQKERDEVLKCTVEEIRGFADMLRDSMKQNYLCVLGNSSKINESKEIFKELIEVFK